MPCYGVAFPDLSDPYTWGMTFGGNMKRRFAFWAAVAFFVVAILCTIQATTGGASGFKALALVALVLGLISAVGVWALGLPKSTDPTNDEAMNAIR